MAGWQLVLDRPLRHKYEDLHFPTAQDGWVISAGGDVLHTTDGGDHWALQASGLGHLRSMVMLDAQRGFAGTLGGVLYRTDDGGGGWRDITADLPTPPAGFCGMTRTGEQVHLVGRFVGGAADHYRSVDGGQTWTHQDLRDQAQGLVEVVFVSEAVGFIGGMAPGEPGAGGPLVLKTTDGGQTWRSVLRPSVGRGFAWKIFAVSPRVLFAALQTQDGVLRTARSTDGGERWGRPDRRRRPAPDPRCAGGGLPRCAARLGGGLVSRHVRHRRRRDRPGSTSPPRTPTSTASCARRRRCSPRAARGVLRRRYSQSESL